jgi:hypothetical protein
MQNFAQALEAHLLVHARLLGFGCHLVLLSGKVEGMQRSLMMQMQKMGSSDVSL